MEGMILIVVLGTICATHDEVDDEELAVRLAVSRKAQQLHFPLYLIDNSRNEKLSFKNFIPFHSQTLDGETFAHSVAETA